MGRGLRLPRPVTSRVERTPAARPLLSIRRALCSTSGNSATCTSVSRGGGGRDVSPLAAGLRVVRSLEWLARYPAHSSFPPFAYLSLSVTTLQAYKKPFPGRHLSRSIRQYCLLKLLGPCKSGMGGRFRTSAVRSHTRPSLVSVGIPTTEWWVLEVTFHVIAPPTLTYVSRQSAQSSAIKITRVEYFLV